MAITREFPWQYQGICFGKTRDFYLTEYTYIVRFTNVISNRFDSTTFKRLYADLYKDFTKPVSSRRFSVSC